LIAAAEEPDGYLYTPRRLIRPDYAPPGGRERWVGIKDQSHELYNAGHLYEAAVAHYLATGKRSLLDVALRNADLVCVTFAPGGRGEVPGHQEIEIGLCKLYRVTGRQRYLLTAKHFLDERGNPGTHQLMGTDMQDHAPVLLQDQAVGHAVRAGYMYAAMADVAALTGDSSYVAPLDKLWNDVTRGKLYITGGIGSVGLYEGFGPSCVLPNHSAYCETCASIAMMLWSHRMFLTHGDARYIDVLERTLYNSFLAGVGMSGEAFFYPNPLESFGGTERSPWFACACCPPNVVRFLPRLGSYAYASRGSDLFVNLYAAGEATVPTERGPVKVRQETRYPWDGSVTITLDPERSEEFTIHLRVPGWAQGETGTLYRALGPAPGDVALAVNGKKSPLEMEKGYAVLHRSWKKNDVIRLTLPMPVRRMVADEQVEEDRGRFALQRGPVVYCLEGVDARDGRATDVFFPDSTTFSYEFRDDLLNGVGIIRGRGISARRTPTGTVVPAGAKDVIAIPYYAWAHRGKSDMTVWPAREISAARPLQAPTLAWKSSLTASSGLPTDAVKDQLEPRSSHDGSIPVSRWWRKKGTSEWLQYDFPSTDTVSKVSVYWFDDGGEYRLPASWRLLYREGNEWKPVVTTTSAVNTTPAVNTGSYPVEKDHATVVTFTPVRTTALRLEVLLAPAHSAGLYEWKVE